MRKYIDKGLSSNSPCDSRRADILNMRNAGLTADAVAKNLGGDDAGFTVSMVKNFCYTHFKMANGHSKNGVLSPHKDYIQKRLDDGAAVSEINRGLRRFKSVNVHTESVYAFIRRHNMKPKSEVMESDFNLLAKPWTADGLSGLVA